MKTWKVLGLVLGVVALMGASCNKQYAPTTTTDTQSPGSTNTAVSKVPAKTVTVKFTDNGWSPSSLTLNVGDTVKFVNNSSSDFWPASTPHPIHTDIPGLNAGKAIGPGGSYSFTFTKPVSAGWHNHLNPSQVGTIMVK